MVRKGKTSLPNIFKSPHFYWDSQKLKTLKLCWPFFALMWHFLLFTIEGGRRSTRVVKRENIPSYGMEIAEAKTWRQEQHGLLSIKLKPRCWGVPGTNTGSLQQRITEDLFHYLILRTLDLILGPQGAHSENLELASPSNQVDGTGTGSEANSACSQNQCRSGLSQAGARNGVNLSNFKWLGEIERKHSINQSPQKRTGCRTETEPQIPSWANLCCWKLYRGARKKENPNYITWPRKLP